jgi:hypothetical protein
MALDTGIHASMTVLAEASRSNGISADITITEKFYRAGRGL